MSKTHPMYTAPRDGTHIVGYCVHEADPYISDDESGCLTDYGASCEGLSHVPDGWHVIEWCGSYSDADDEYGTNAFIQPGWWFRVGSEREEAANPVCWLPLPPPPVTVTETQDGRAGGEAGSVASLKRQHHDSLP